ncbi:MAG TPA: PadR family transcriptional regulator [Longimicrobiales bacterium]|nr:PadR family transcriptional regulator [Longimicrobiales bacterium]
MSRALGVTTVVVLSVIERSICYGLDIVNRTGLLPGTVYTTLRRLERRGWIEGRWEDPAIAESERRPRRRYYELSREGLAALQTARGRLQDLGVELPADLDLAVAGDSE